jgi:hypothetical protein
MSQEHEDCCKCDYCDEPCDKVDDQHLCPEHRGYPCIECGRLIEVEGSQYCNWCRPCECGNCDEIGGTCEAQTAKYEEEEAQAKR